MHNYIVYLAYGKDYVNECRYSLLKYLSTYNLRPPSHSSVIVYTDAAAAFDFFLPHFPHFKIETITDSQLNEWKGKQNNPYRVKAFVIKNFLKQCNGNFLFCDTDTFPLKELEPLFSSIGSGTVYMHKLEGVLNPAINPQFKKWSAALKNQQLQIDSQTFVFPETMQMWNSGIVGLACKDSSYLDEVLVLTDFFFEKKQHHTTEQMAISYLLQKKTEIKEASEYFCHYWNLKEFRSLLQIFFRENAEESIPNLVKAVHYLDAQVIQQQKQQYEKQPLHRKWLNALVGKSWSIKQYKKKW